MKDFKLKSRVQMLKESIEIDPKFNINPVLKDYLDGDFPVNNFFDYKYSGKKTRLQYVGKDAAKAQYHFVGANGESITFEEETMLRHILDNVLIPEVNPKIKAGEEFGENNIVEKPAKGENHNEKDNSKFKSENQKDKIKFKSENQKYKKDKFSDLTDKAEPVIVKDKETFKDSQKIDESLNIDILASEWDDMYGEDFKELYSGVANELESIGDFSLDNLVTIWDDMYSEDFKEKYEAIYDILSEMNEDEDFSEIELENQPVANPIATIEPEASLTTTKPIDNEMNQDNQDDIEVNPLADYIDAIKNLTSVSIIEFSDENSEYPHVKFNVVDSQNLFELAYIDDQVKLITIKPEDEKVVISPEELVDFINSLESATDSAVLPIDAASNDEETEPIQDENGPGVINESLKNLFELEDLDKVKKEDLEMFNSLSMKDLSSVWSGGKIDKSKGFDEIIDALIDVKGFKEFKDDAALIVFSSFSDITERTANSLNKNLIFTISKKDYEKLSINDLEDYFDNYKETVSEDPKHVESKSDLKSQFDKSATKKINSGADLKGLDALAYIELDYDKAEKLIEKLNYNKLGISIKKK